MPELELTAYPTLSTWAGTQVLAVMLYPSDPEARQHLLAVSAAKMLAQADLAGLAQTAQGVTLLRDVLTSAADAPSAVEVQHRAAQMAGYAGPVAGDILLLVWQMEQHGLRGSLNKAIEKVLVGEGPAQGVYYGYADADGKPVPCNRKDVWNAWRSYKSVAHLWTVAHIAEAEGMLKQVLSHDLLRFLAYAEAFRDFGENLTPHARKEPLLNPAETWKVPAHFPLPPVTLHPLPLHSLELGLLGFPSQS
jgi:hypothetical protein